MYYEAVWPESSEIDDVSWFEYATMAVSKTPFAKIRVVQ